LPNATTRMQLGDPPETIYQSRLPIKKTPIEVIRISEAKHPNPIYWSKLGLNRFDSPSAPLGVYYTGQDFETALIEVFGDRWISTRRILNRGDLQPYMVHRIELKNPSEVVNLTGKGLSRIGTDANLCISYDYAVTQKWAIAFMRHPQEPQGIVYHSRHNPRKLNYALFGDASLNDQLKVVHQVALLEHPELFKILYAYRVSMIP
jgi:RES domain